MSLATASSGPADHRLERVRLGGQLQDDVDPIRVGLRVLSLTDHEGPAIEGLGVLGAGAHSNDAEYIFLNSIEPRLYLLSRMIMQN